MWFWKFIRYHSVIFLLIVVSSCANKKTTTNLPLSHYLEYLQNLVENDKRFQMRVLGFEPVSGFLLYNFNIDQLGNLQGGF